MDTESRDGIKARNFSALYRIKKTHCNEYIDGNPKLKEKKAPPIFKVDYEARSAGSFTIA